MGSTAEQVITDFGNLEDKMVPPWNQMVGRGSFTQYNVAANCLQAFQSSNRQLRSQNATCPLVMLSSQVVGDGSNVIERFLQQPTLLHCSPVNVCDSWPWLAECATPIAVRIVTHCEYPQDFGDHLQRLVNSVGCLHRMSQCP